MWKRKLLVLSLIFSSLQGMGHPMPHSVLSLSVRGNQIFSELKVPVSELQFAVPFDVSGQTAMMLKDERRAQLSQYFLEHIRPGSNNGSDWKVEIMDMRLDESEQEATGRYQELALQLMMQPPPGESVRNFQLYIDAVLHQVMTHKIFVTVKQDWQNGRDGNNEFSLGVIELNIAANSVFPMSVNLEDGSTLKGVVSMIWLGFNHIAGGTDHLLFLLVLLLPATLIAEKRRWAGFAGTRKSVLNILKIVTAFTLGHSFSLLLGAKQWLVLPQQPVETAIAATIFITAVHAIRPIFPKREMLTAVLFGLVHGLAFSSVLTEMNLETTEMAYSILGYNIGIELMQIFVLVLTMPWIIILSKNNHLKWLRVSGAVLALTASAAWGLERIELQPNMVSTLIEQVLSQGKWILLILMIAAIVSILGARFGRLRIAA